MSPSCSASRSGFQVAASVLLLAALHGGVAAQTNLAIGIQIQNLLEHNLDVFWVNQGKSVALGWVEAGNIFATNSYIGHTFVFKFQDVEQARVRVKGSSTWYVMKDDESEARYPAVWKTSVARTEFEFDYFEDTGRLWYGYWPKEPSELHMWNISEVGQTWTIDNAEDGVPFEQELTVLSVSPKVVLAKDFLSHEDADEIINTAKPLMKRSTTGTGNHAREDTTRTSSQVFLPKNHGVVRRLYAKVAKLLNIDHDKVMAQTEQLQVVHYTVGQEYKAHHDWGKDKVTRFVTVLLYLNDQANPDAGGQTHFGKADLKVHPGKGSAVMFYNMLEDGSADDRSLHAALAVNEGEKYICNVWLRDYQDAIVPKSNHLDEL